MIRKWHSSIAVLVTGVMFSIAAWGQGSPAVSIAVNGAEQVSSDGVWDTGAIKLTVNGYPKILTGYGQFSTPESLASWMAARLSMDTHAPVWAKASGNTITMVSRFPGVPVTASGVPLSWDTGHFGSPSFWFGGSSGTSVPPALTLHCTPNAIGPGQVTSCTATITGMSQIQGAPLPSNPVVFTINGGPWTSESVNGNGTAVAEGGLSGASAATYTIAASYAADGTYPAMNASTTVTVGSSIPATASVYSYTITQPDGSTSGFDAAGNITAYFDSTAGQWTNIQYDSLNRLVAASGPSSAFNGGLTNFCWSYDNFGNRTSQNSGSGVFTWSWGSCSGGGSIVSTNVQSYSETNNNQLTSASLPLSTFRYDPGGNIISDGTHGYAYDGEGRLCAVSSPSSIPGITTYTGYLYNAEGQRVAKGIQSSLSCDLTSNDFTLSNMYIMGPDGSAMTETDGSGAWTHTDVSANGELIATYDKDSPWVHFQFTDWLGSRRIQTNYKGTVESGVQTLPFGETIPSPPPGFTEKNFTGKERDTESGNDYFGARYYASSMGRFMSPDPIGGALANPQSLNRYAYVLSNPLGYSDPTGLKPCLLAGGGTGDDGELGFDDDSTQMNVSGCPDAPNLGSTDTQARLNSLTSSVGDSQSVSQQSSNGDSFDPGSMAAALFSPQIGGPYFGGANNLVTNATIGATAAYGGAFFAPAIAGATSTAASWGANTSGLLGPATNRIFWSAIGSGAAAERAAEEGGTTLEMTPLGGFADWVLHLRYAPQWPTTRPVWNWLSASFASGAQGPVKYLQGDRLGDMWQYVERPILVQQGNPIITVPVP